MTATARRRTIPVTVREVAWDDPVGAGLRAAMEAEMEQRYADRLAALVTGDDDIAATLGVDAGHVAYAGVGFAAPGVPVGHAALRWAGPDLELKRMYVVPAYRGRGVAVALLTAVEDAARRLGVRRIILQTGDRQPDAVRLYEREGYSRIPIFPPYERLTFSICMEKVLR
ncbi:GNAT family N-acetyltransferase [Actinoallomurus vinaceus]|uniref:GNAT family N-acetyltransferase n=1 Tax=Actinoallomurus vinaceus TaxID=1080074 RepID=A0ABP8UTH9_9ACTN